MPPQTSETLRMRAPVSGVTVRMYDLNGEGDCFLLAFRAEDETDRYMLIDCGLFVRTAGGADRLRDVAKDIAEATGNHLHILVATHEHWDHLIGFEYAKKTFEEMVIDEVWLAWTENLETDELAKKLHEKYEAAAKALAIAVKQLDEPQAAPIMNVLAYHWDFTGELGVTTNDLMNKVHKVLSSNPVHYCSPDNPPIILPKVPGLRFYVLGPPRSESLLKILEVESSLHGEPLVLDDVTAFYCGVLASLGGKELGAGEKEALKSMNEHCRPFDETLGMTKEQAQDYKLNDEFFFEKHYGLAEEDPEKGWRRIDSDWLETAGQLALHMDSYTNNTSLVLAIELTQSGKVLLFPGDAQGGNWRSWKDGKWSIHEDGDEKVVTGMDLVQRTAFYKVGHHGSHNGTLAEYLRQMRSDLVAMIPVNQEWAKKRNWEHPGGTLLEELMKQTNGCIIRADTRLPDVKPTDLSQGEWQEFTGKVQEDQSENKLWIQYTLQG